MHNVSRGVYDVLRLFKPYDIDVEKVRFGKERDGCYILADLPGQADVISFGIFDDVSFETDMADQGRRVFMFDHTIPGLPAQHKLFHYQKLGICGIGGSTSELRTLREHLDAIPDLSRDLILKIDVEGHEWDVFANIDSDTLERFEQIVVEWHWMENLRDPRFCSRAFEALQSITRQFTMFHVHANNGRSVTIVDGFVVADVLEVSYVRTSRVRRRRSATVYPTSMNKANNPADFEIPLLFYPFLPVSIENERVEDLVSRVVADGAPAR